MKCSCNACYAYYAWSLENYLNHNDEDVLLADWNAPVNLNSIHILPSDQMTYQTCWRCLSKSQIPFSLKRIHPSALFTTSAPVQALPPKNNKLPTTLPQKGRRATFLRKSKAKRNAEPRGKKMAIGERRALRKRIVLSNNNAIAVEGVPEFGPESIGDAQLRGQVVGFSVSMVDRLRAVEAFKRTQRWGLFWKPAMLVRQETVEYGQFFNEMSDEQGPRRSIRRVLVGERGSGKSIIMLQAMTMAFLKGWVVINLPEGTIPLSPPFYDSLPSFWLILLRFQTDSQSVFIAQDLVLGHTEYRPVPQTSPLLFEQKVYTASLLSAIARANPILSTLTLKSPPPQTPFPIQPSITLLEFALLGADNPEIAYPIFQTLIQDLLLPSRPPLLLCIDSLVHVMKYSAYRNAAFELIHAHDLAIVNWFMGHLSGASALPNGGMVLAATSGSNPCRNPSLDIALRELEFPPPSPSIATLYPETEDATFRHNPNWRNPFIKYDQRVLDVFSRPGMEIQRLKGLSKDETRSLMEYWAKSGVVRQKVNDTLVGEKWALSGGGVVGELERATIAMKI